MDDAAVSPARAAASRILAGDEMRRRGEAIIIEEICALAESYRLGEPEVIERQLRLGDEATATEQEFLSLSRLLAANLERPTSGVSAAEPKVQPRLGT